jgi:hypothetical protein
MGKKDKGQPLRIVCAALRLSSDHKVLFAGVDHIAALDRMTRAKKAYKYYDFEQGFIVSDGTFAHRVRAMEIAKEAGQLDTGYKAHPGELLFGYMLKNDYNPGARKAKPPVAVKEKPQKKVKSETLPPELAALRPEDPDDDFVGD